ncbi:MAG: DivIVA domain-containing protein [bacterium]|nr:DivIVA domain-containing protein [bacterium]
MKDYNNDFAILTPADISRIKFNTSFKGYNKEEVDEFLEQLNVYYTKLWKENIELKNKVEYLTKELEHYKKLENTIQESLVTSKKISNEIIQSAKLEAENIIKKAQLNQLTIENEYKKIFEKLQNDINQLKNLRNDLLKETKYYLSILLEKLSEIENGFNVEEEYYKVFFNKYSLFLKESTDECLNKLLALKDGVFTLDFIKNSNNNELKSNLE